jgi:prepilin signal peptidase PulO-like enzyme (type II secretory pathway)
MPGRRRLGGIALAGFYLVLALISPSGMGMGDVKAAAGPGVMLAWPGWASLIAGSFAGFTLAAVYGAVLLISGHATRKSQFPFGPFMIAGAFLVVLIGGPCRFPFLIVPFLFLMSPVWPIGDIRVGRALVVAAG